jgi:hypothetical protein
MTDSKRLNLVLGAVAVTILVCSFTAYAYVQIPKGNPDVLVVNGAGYSWDTLFSDFETVAFTANGEERLGIPLELLILDSGVQSPESHTYSFKGLDGYTGQKDFSWTDIQNGYLIEEQHRAVFPEYTQSFWVRDLASIEVI